MNTESLMNKANNLVFLNSKDAVNPREPHNLSFNLNMLFKDTAVKSISLENISFPNNVYPVNSTNNTLVFTENSGAATTTVTITTGFYTGTSLASFLTTAMTAATQAANTFTVSYDSASKKLTIAVAGNNYRITSSSTCLDIIGYEQQTSVQTTSTGNYPVMLAGSDFVDIRTNLSIGNVSSSGSYNILCRVPILEGFGSYIFYSPPRETMLGFGDAETRYLDLQLFDDKGRIWTMPANSKVSITLRLNY